MKKHMKIAYALLLSLFVCLIAVSCESVGIKCNHLWSDATCTTPKTCTKCTLTEGTAAGHTWSTGIFDSEPTCTEPGSITFICTICNETRLEVAPATGHDHDKTVKAATLVSSGYEEYQCKYCTDTYVNIIDIVDPYTLNMPIVFLTDTDESPLSLAELQKEDGEITVSLKYEDQDNAARDFEGYCKIKIQGTSSSVYPKKNFTIKLFEDEALEVKLKVDLGWGSQSKYCLKANYIDYSQARNIVAARMFGQVAATRVNIAEGLKNAPNYGAADGYPVLVYLNGEFHGIYTMNIPKDEWMFAMEGKEDSREAVLMADHWTDSVRLYEKIGDDYANCGWDIEYCSAEDERWVLDSFNKLIELLNCGNAEKIKSKLSGHLDIEAAIDNMLFTYFINSTDNVAKNILWATYDGEIWIPSMYDMDGTFGIYHNGTATDAALPESIYSICPSVLSDGTFDVGNMMYRILLTYYADAVETRYAELRKTVLTYENTERHFNAFFDKINDIAYISDLEKWQDIPDADKNLDNMLPATAAQLKRLDNFFYGFNK